MKPPSAFTLIELLVVLTIIAIIGSLCVPACHRIRNSSTPVDMPQYNPNGY